MSMESDSSGAAFILLERGTTGGRVNFEGAAAFIEAESLEDVREHLSAMPLPSLRSILQSPTASDQSLPAGLQDASKWDTSGADYILLIRGPSGKKVNFANASLLIEANAPEAVRSMLEAKTGRPHAPVAPDGGVRHGE